MYDINIIHFQHSCSIQTKANQASMVHLNAYIVPQKHHVTYINNVAYIQIKPCVFNKLTRKPLC